MSESRTDPIAILGGTGKEGSALALRFATAGYPVIIGSREAVKAQEKASEISRLLPRAVVDWGENGQVAGRSQYIYLCVPFDSAGALLDDCRTAFMTGAVVIDTTVPLQFEAGRLMLRRLPERSGSEHLASRLRPDVSLVAAFKTIPAHVLSELEHPLDCDLVVCGDNAASRQRVIELARAIDGLRPLDGGPLSHAQALEAMCALAIGLNRRYKSKTARFRIVGV
jgi:NADPH-dependent F420 reductase